ncbi:MAG: SRPBCC domain-containing protein [Bacteroidota bacterium]|nr:SRPBCC domain-containing protein [Bacteroidota bacterium]
MADKLIVVNTITIDAPASKVWNALVNPEETKKYMFGCETVSDWNVGSELLWRGEYEGQDMVFVKGNIVALEPDKLLSYTVIDPNNTELADIPENYLTVTYELKEENGETQLIVTQGDYATVGNGKQRYEDTVESGGWQSILDRIKELVETGEIIPEG